MKDRFHPNSIVLALLNPPQGVPLRAEIQQGENSTPVGSSGPTPVEWSRSWAGPSETGYRVSRGKNSTGQGILSISGDA
jgi:hypothetical protein